MLVIATLFISVSSSYVFMIFFSQNYILSFLMFIRLPRTSSIKMVEVWLLFTLMIPFAEALLHTRMEQLKQKLKQLENRVVTMKNSQEITKNQVQPISESQSTTTPSMVMPLDGIVIAWEEDKVQMIKKLRYIHIYFPILKLF